MESQAFLQEAYKEAKKLLSSKDLEAYQMHYIAWIFAELADSDDNLDEKERTTMFQKAIEYFQKIADKDGEECDFYSLGHAQATFSEHCIDFKEKSELRKKAIENFKKSYELDKDPETLEIISELEDEELAH